MSLHHPIDLLLVDDHPLVRDGLRARLESLPHLRIVGEADNAESTLALVAQLHPQLVLMDINLGNASGITLTANLAKIYPDLAIVMLSMHDKAEYVVQSMQAGARAYVLKDAPAEDILAAIDAVVAGGNYFSAKIKKPQDFPNLHNNLTLREQDILKNIATGKSNKHIAKDLGLSVRTVETHRLNIKRKLNIEGQADLIRYALKHVQV